ncbi:MAG: hypothetical protein ACTSU0_01835 [Alphaproteobacteria bacterium]
MLENIDDPPEGRNEVGKMPGQRGIVVTCAIQTNREQRGKEVMSLSSTPHHEAPLASAASEHPGTRTDAP